MKSINESFSTKLYCDYNSNITCLPGSQFNVTQEKPRIISLRKFQTSDIFNTQPDTPSKNGNLFNKKNSSKIFGESEQEKLFIQQPTAQLKQLENVLIILIQSFI